MTTEVDKTTSIVANFIFVALLDDDFTFIPAISPQAGY